MNTTALSKRLLGLSGVLFAGYATGVISFSLIGSKVDAKGILREPFFLLPLSAVCLVGSTISLAGAGVAHWKERP